MLSEASKIPALLAIGFAQDLIQFQSAILFVLVAYWFGARWSRLKEKFSPEAYGGVWLTVTALFAVFLVAIFIMEWGTEFVLMALALGVGIALSMTDSAISVCFFTALLFLRPWEVVLGNDYFGILPKLTFGLSAANAAIELSRRKNFLPFWSRTASWLLLFAGWVLLSTFKSPDAGSAQSLFFDGFVKCAFLFMLISNVIDSKAELDLVVATVVITMFGVGVIAMYQTLTVMEALKTPAGVIDVRLLGFGAFANSNDIAALMVMVLPFCLVPFMRKGSTWLLRLACVPAVAIVLACVHLSKSRGALLGVLSIIGLAAILTIRSRKVAAAVAVVGIVGALAFAQVSNRDSEDLEQSSSSRLTYIKTGLMMGLKNPMLGVGFDGYQQNFERYATEILYEWGHRTAHNSWILALAETGFPGFIFFCGIFFSALAASIRYLRVYPEFMLSLVGYGVAMTFLSHTYLIYPYLLFGWVVVASRIHSVQAFEQEARA